MFTVAKLTVIRKTTRPRQGEKKYESHMEAVLLCCRRSSLAHVQRDACPRRPGCQEAPPLPPALPGRGHRGVSRALEEAGVHRDVSAQGS